MSAKATKVEFAEDGGFELRPKFDGKRRLRERFATLQNELLAEELGAAQNLLLHRRLKQAANEAAGVAWTTEFPLLVFPALFDEFTSRERLREERQQRILARTETLLEETV